MLKPPKSVKEAMAMTWTKTFRDPVHGDIELKEWEVAVIDTPQFQRLRGIRQLGLADYVYPGAIHTRFEHSIGTVYMAQKIIDALNRGVDSEPVISDADANLIRLSALLHDIGHLPFGHTLEEECNILSSRHGQWDRLRHYIGERTEIGAILAGTGYYNKVVSTLKLLNGEGTDEPVPPFIADIVGNTVCADLLDYLMRDGYHCGLRLGYDDRIIKYFAIDSQTRRLVVLLEKNGEFRRDNVSELIDLLRNRYALAEKVLFHHTKLAASAMLARAFQLSGLGEADILDLGQEQLLEILAHSENPAVADLAKRLRNRQLHKIVFRVSGEYAALGRKRDRLCQLFHDNPQARLDIESTLEQRFTMSTGSICIYCPDKEMLFKPADVQVVPITGMPPQTLSQLSDGTFSRDVNSLKDKHDALWTMGIFLHPDLYHQCIQVAMAFQETMRGKGLEVENDLDARPSRRWREARLRSQEFEQFIREKDLRPTEEEELQLELVEYAVSARHTGHDRDFKSLLNRAYEQW